MMRFGMILAFLLFFGAETVSADEGEMLRDSKQELDRIKKQLSDTQQKVDSLNQLEGELQKAISGYGERVNRNRKVIGKMENQLGAVRKDLAKNNDLLSDTESRLKRKREVYINLLVDYYRKKKSEMTDDIWDFGSVMMQNRRIYYLSSLSDRSTREIARVDDSLQRLAQHVDSLERTGSDIKRQQREKQAKIDLDLTLKEKEETSLGKVRRQSNLFQERLETLSEAARRMEEIIAEIEYTQELRRRQAGEIPRYRAGAFDQYKGALRPPIRGKIVSSFGWKKDKITNLSSFAPGIDIQPSPGHKDVIACAPGRVVYIGRLRGYDNFVILEHDDGFYTTYAGLGEVSVDPDALLNTGDKVGTLAGNKVHFEIRRGREHLDPVIWLDINEF